MKWGIAGDRRVPETVGSDAIEPALKREIRHRGSEADAFGTAAEMIARVEVQECVSQFPTRSVSIRKVKNTASDGVEGLPNPCGEVGEELRH